LLVLPWRHRRSVAIIVNLDFEAKPLGSLIVVFWQHFRGGHFVVQRQQGYDGRSNPADSGEHKARDDGSPRARHCENGAVLLQRAVLAACPARTVRYSLRTPF
jgi:hypothetical protein